MPHPQLNRHDVKMTPLAERNNQLRIESKRVPPGTAPGALGEGALELIAEAAERIGQARAAGRPVILAFGAHTIKNGLGPVLIDLMEKGWVTHLATNGAAIIHDWEFAWQGQSGEDVRANVAAGTFGNWQETGYFINLALNVGGWAGLGYGESVGALIQTEGLDIPGADRLKKEAADRLEIDPRQAAAAADLLGVVREFALEPGRLAVAHPFKQYSVQAAAWRLGVPLTGHPMIGHDIIYNHPMNHGGLLGRAALRDFLAFADSVSRLEGGVYLSVGSAVMSPMIFEKSLSMGQNLALQAGRRIEHHYLFVADLAQSAWDWRQGEPPQSSPDYYLRYNKTFSRMGGTMRYLSVDNRDFLLALARVLPVR